MGMKKAKEIASLHNKIVAYRSSRISTYARDEYLRGWERALRWVMKQEDPPSEFLENVESVARARRK